jgi:hypothetical protein
VDELQKSMEMDGVSFLLHHFKKRYPPVNDDFQDYDDDVMMNGEPRVAPSNGPVETEIKATSKTMTTI